MSFQGGAGLLPNVIFGFQAWAEVSLAEVVLLSRNAALQSVCWKENKDRISKESGDFLASQRHAGRVSDYCCICPSCTAQNTCEPRALWALWPQEVSKCLLGYLLPANRSRSACHCSSFALMHHLTVSLVMAQSASWTLDKEQADGIMYIFSAPLQQILQQP